MKKKIYSLSLILFLSVYTISLEAKTSKETWLEYTGTNFCEKGFCAELVPQRPLELALNYYKENQGNFLNDRYIGIIDFRIDSTQKRLFILNLKNGSVRTLLVTHGKKSEIEKAMASDFSNEIGSEKSSLGFYKTGLGPYIGKHGQSLKLYGLSSTNSNAFVRGIVIHSADYATEWFSKEKGRLGLSQGCPAVSPDMLAYVLDRLQGGGLLFIYSTEFDQ